MVDYLDHILAIAALLISTYLLTCLLKPHVLLETILFSFSVSTALIITWGYMVSFFNQLGNLMAWSIAGIITTILAAILFAVIAPGGIPLQRQMLDAITNLCKWYTREVTQYEKIILLLMGLSVLAVVVLNFAMVLFVAPHTWDALTYHLARMAYYIQHGNFSAFGANYWAQVIHPKNSASLMIFIYLVTGRNENLTQILQYIAHLVFILCVYGISKKTGAGTTQGVFSAFTAGLLVIGVLQSATAQNDLIIAAYFGIALYALFAFCERQYNLYLFMAGLNMALAVGTKSSTLVALPSMAMLVVYLLAWKRPARRAWQSLLLLCGFGLAASLVFVLPSGYLENYKMFGHPVGNLEVRQMHSFEGQNWQHILKAGLHNSLRFGIDFISLDGLPTTEMYQRAQDVLRYIPLQFTRLLRMDLTSNFAVGFSPFDLKVDRVNIWGVLGFGVVWIAVIISLWRAASNTDVRILSAASIIFFLGQAFSGPYDAARGRYFLVCALFAVPVAGMWLTFQRQWARIYLALVVCVACISAIYPLASKTYLFRMDRNEQATSETPAYYATLKLFEFIVPPNAVVATYLYPNMYEYLLFGKNLTRTILPINSFYEGRQPIPPEAEYLLYAEGYPCWNKHDKHLSNDLYLRKLDDTNRGCP